MQICGSVCCAGHGSVCGGDGGTQVPALQVRFMYTPALPHVSLPPWCRLRAARELHCASLLCRLMHFDRETLYELHYQMITVGKVQNLSQFFGLSRLVMAWIHWACSI